MILSSTTSYLSYTLTSCLSINMCLDCNLAMIRQMKKTEMLIMVVIIVAAADAQTTTLNCGQNVSTSDYGRNSVRFVAGVSGRYTITTCSTYRGYGSCRVSYGDFEWPTQASTSMRISEYWQRE